MKRIFTLFVALATACVVMAAECVIVPRPVSFEPQKGKVTLNSKSVVYVADKSLVCPATMFCSYVVAEKGLQLSVVESQPKGKGAISLSIDKSLAQEEYLLNVTKNGIAIIGGSEQGVFYGLQSLRQVVFHSKGDAKKVSVECMTVKDKPHFDYRGGMLDVCRHIFSVEEVKKYIDILALHKMNRFHWHLTEDQGWRIEIKKYPNLTKVGSMRKETIVDWHGAKKVYDGKSYGGYFTQDEVRDIVRYATERYIEVIPEVDMPGHMVAALASYPELGCTKGPYEVRTKWGISKDVLCAGRESTFEFVEGVLSEIMELFPSKYIHIGGDECPKHRWKACPECQKRIQEEGLKDEFELQSYFMHRVENFLAKHGRSIIGWDEILEGGISKTATIMAWRGPNHGIKAAQLGNKVIMTPKTHCYLDYCQTSNREANGEPVCGGRNGKRVISLRKSYSLDPYDQLNEAEREFVIGVQGNMWTEFVATFDHLQQMILPRSAALAEVGWSYGNKDYDDFARRMHLLRKLYDKCGYKYASYFYNGIE